eukprot:5742543-Amphidinium_carterae.2
MTTTAAQTRDEPMSDRLASQLDRQDFQSFKLGFNDHIFSIHHLGLNNQKSDSLAGLRMQDQSQSK